MDKQTGPKGFLVVLPGEIIEIPQDSDKSWLTLFYSLPRELAEKWKPAYELPRCPYEVLRTDKYDHIVCDDIGMTINHYIMKLRIKKALQRIDGGETSVSAVATAVGFSSANYFCKCFKKELGLVPSDYIGKRKTDGRM